MHWKTLIYDYVHHKNQMEIDYSVEPLQPFVEDAGFLSIQRDRLVRMYESARERELSPVKNETRLSIVRIREQEDEVTADIALKRTMVSQIRGETVTERRIEGERLQLERRSGRWHIVRIRDLTGERAFTAQAQAPSGFLQAEDPSNSEMMTSPSVPYLNQELIRLPELAARRVPYNRARVVQYADTWWNASNPAFITFEVDCTNYVSQCLFAGGAPMHYTGKRDSGWWYKGKVHGQELWSYSWAVANSLQWYLTASKSGLRAVEVESPLQLTYGDTIAYDWDGSGRFQHNTIVTAIDPGGMPLVNAHTVSSQHRYWEYKDSYAWTPRTRYRFLHIPDSL